MQTQPIRKAIRQEVATLDVPLKLSQNDYTGIERIYRNRVLDYYKKRLDTSIPHYPDMSIDELRSRAESMGKKQEHYLFNKKCTKICIENFVRDDIPNSLLWENMAELLREEDILEQSAQEIDIIEKVIDIKETIKKTSEPKNSPQDYVTGMWTGLLLCYLCIPKDSLLACIWRAIKKSIRTPSVSDNEVKEQHA